MAKGINVFLIMQGRVIPMSEGNSGQYYYNDEGWAICFCERGRDIGRGNEVNIYTEFVAEITFYDPEFFIEMDDLVQEYFSPIYLRAVTSCFEDKWGKVYVVM